VTSKNKRKSAKAGGALPSSSKIPKRASELSVGEDIDLPSSNPCWNFSLMDRSYDGGSWDWDLSIEEHVQFLDFLHEMQKLTWKEIWAQTTGGRVAHRKHHDHDTDSLCAEARERLSDVKLGEQSKLFRFRLGGTIRVWGFFRNSDHQFYLLWWDRDHEVYPVST
jgi:hypothetical protein